MKTKILTLATLGFLLMGCERVDEQTTVEERNTVGVAINYYIDPDTGVCYLIYDGGYDGGITVRYNADGSIMVKEN